MNKTEFINILTHTLKERKISDIDEIVAEYEQHFLVKIADGQSEEEITARLGDPKVLGNYFDLERGNTTKGTKVITIIGISFVDILFSLVYILLYTWVIFMGILAFICISIGFLLVFNLDISNLLPYMPYLIGFIFAIMMIALAVLTAIGTAYFWLFTRQIFRSYRRWHKNTLSSAAGKGILPNVPVHPQISTLQKRRIRKILLITLIAFVITAQVGFIIAAIIAGTFEFWHVWNWF